MLNPNQKELIGFTVHRQPLVGSIDKTDSELDIITKPTDGKVLGVIPRKQFIVPHIDAVDRVQRAIQQHGIPMRSTRFELVHNGARLFVHYRAEESSLYGHDTEGYLYPEVILKNGYDGDVTFGLEFGLYRQVCSNGARIMVVGHRASKRTQLGDVDVEVIMNQMKDFFTDVLTHVWARVQEMIGTATTGLTSEVRTWLAQQVSEKMLGVFDTRVKEEADRIGTDQLTEWVLFNVVTWMITHHVHSYNRQRYLEQVAAKRFRFGNFKLNSST